MGRVSARELDEGARFDTLARVSEAKSTFNSDEVEE